MTKKKIDLISTCSPYTLKNDEMITEIENFASISYPDTVNYFLFSLSPLNKEELKTYKGLESYNQHFSEIIIQNNQFHIQFYR